MRGAAGVVACPGEDRRFRNLDRGRSGGVDLHAAVGGRDEAARLAGGIRRIWVDHAVLAGDVPDPETTCGQDRCADEVDAFRDAFRRAVPGPDHARPARWSAGREGPLTSSRWPPATGC